MSNTNDLFVREVDDELRQDKLKSVWRRFGTVLISAAVAIILAVAAWTGYTSWSTGRANASGDRFLAALDSARAGNSDEALKGLTALEADGTGAYPLLARFRAATLTAAKDPKAAVAAFDAVAADTTVSEPLRDIAKLRAAYLLVDHGTYVEVAQRAEALSADGNPMRYSALEAMGLSAYKAGDNANAQKLFETITADTAAPDGVASRATIMLSLIGGTAPKSGS
jgi:hypothetical protein